MLDDRVKEFASANHQAVLTTFRRNGAAQMSIVTVGPYGEGVGFTTTEDRAKLHNLVRDSRCSLLVSKSDWWGYVVLEGRAKVLRRGEGNDEEAARGVEGDIPLSLRPGTPRLGGLRPGDGRGSQGCHHSGSRSCVWDYCRLTVQFPTY